mgnify:CR=1 FL=1
MSENEEQPYYKHDCDRCVFLGNAYDHRNEAVGDMYWCQSPSTPSLDSVIFRYDSEGSKYISAHPPNDHHSIEDYAKAYSWFPIIIGRATNRGLFNPNRKLSWDERNTSKMTEEEHDVYMKWIQYGWTIDLLKEELAKTRLSLVKRYGEMDDAGYHFMSSGDVQIFSCLKIIIEHMKAEREAL